jgi:hypothetical protein
MPDKHAADTPCLHRNGKVESMIHNVVNNDARIGLLVD